MLPDYRTDATLVASDILSPFQMEFRDALIRVRHPDFADDIPWAQFCGKLLLIDPYTGLYLFREALKPKVELVLKALAKEQCLRILRPMCFSVNRSIVVNWGKHICARDRLGRLALFFRRWEIEINRGLGVKEIRFIIDVCTQGQDTPLYPLMQSALPHILRRLETSMLVEPAFYPDEQLGTILRQGSYLSSRVKAFQQLHPFCPTYIPDPSVTAMLA